MRKSFVSALALLTFLAPHAAAQNLLKNPGFEDPTASQGSSLGKWFRFGSGANGVAGESTTFPHGGARHISLNVIGPNQFAGVFQMLEDPGNPGTPLAISPGQELVFKGFHRDVGPSSATSELKIEWTGAPQNRLNVQDLADSYAQFTHSAVAPPGTTGATITYAISTFGPGQGDSHVVVDDFEVYFGPIEPAAQFLRGDPNEDGLKDLSDAVTILTYLFLGSQTPSCLDAADSNDDGILDLSDAVFLLSFLFLGGPATPPPAAGCGTDATAADDLSCESYPPCS